MRGLQNTGPQPPYEKAPCIVAGVAHGTATTFTACSCYLTELLTTALFRLGAPAGVASTWNEERKTAGIMCRQ